MAGWSLWTSMPHMTCRCKFAMHKRNQRTPKAFNKRCRGRETQIFFFPLIYCWWKLRLVGLVVYPTIYKAFFLHSRFFGRRMFEPSKSRSKMCKTNGPTKMGGLLFPWKIDGNSFRFASSKADQHLGQQIWANVDDGRWNFQFRQLLNSKERVWPLKTNMEPENHLFEEENNLPKLHFWVPC